MIKLIIVEDEKLEREGLMDFFDWTNMGIEISGTAADGIEGLELAKRVAPDIIITDIKMPGMDGLQMSKQIRELLPNVKIILLTGYDDFNYAREAIGFRANAYILKPIDEDEMQEAIREACRQSEDQKKVAMKLSTEFLKAKNRFLWDFLEGFIQMELAEALFEEYDIHRIKGSDAQYCLVMVGCRNGQDCTEPMESWQMTKEIQASQREYLVFDLFDEQQYEALICLKAEGEDCAKLMKELHEIEEHQSHRFFSFISPWCTEPGALPKAYAKMKEDRENLLFWEQKFSNEGGCDSVQERERSPQTAPDREKGISEFIQNSSSYSKQLMKATAENNGELVKSILKELFQFIEKYRGIDRKHVLNFLYNIVYEISLMAYNMNKDGDEFSLNKDHLGSHIYHLRNLEEVHQYLSDFFEKAVEMIDNKKNRKDEYIINTVLRMIDERYANDLSLKIISTEVFLSPNYLGSLFKKHTGKSFNDYLSDVRMSKAKDLLKSTNKKISIVAAEVGIPNTSYFCIVFKNANGVAPQEYRELYLLK